MNDFRKFVIHLKFESLALAILMIVLTIQSDYSLWWLLLLFPVYDIGMIGYLKDPRLGALIYNLSHNMTLPTLLIAYGVYFDSQLVSFMGIAWTFHITADRCFGFGLKHNHSFHDTHLGSLKPHPSSSAKHK